MSALIGVVIAACHSSAAPMAPLNRPASIDCLAAPWWFIESSGLRLWPEEEWQSGQDTVPRTPDHVAGRLRGNYRLFVATSEGEGAKRIGEWTLRLERTPAAQDSAWQSLWNGARRRIYFPLIGTMEYRRGGFLNADGSLVSTAGGRTPALDSVRVRYQPALGILELEAAPFDRTDSGTPYAIYAVDSTGGFSGRWIMGGIGIAVIPTPLGTVGEQSGGYFCARRDAPR